MKCRSLSYLFLLLFPLLPLRSQTSLPALFGLVTEGAYGVVDGTASIYGSSPDCGRFTSGSLSSFRVGAVVSAPAFFSPRFGLSLRPGWSSSVVRFSARPENPPWVFDATVNRDTEIEREFRLEASSRIFRLGLLGTYRIGERILLGLGPEVGYRFAQSVRQTDHILGPSELAFPDGQTVRSMVEGATYSVNPWAFGLVGSGSITVPVGSHLSFLLEGVASADFLSPVRQGTWRGFSLGGSVGLVFLLDRESLPPPLFPDIGEPTPPSPPLLHLSAAIEIYGLEGEKRRDTITSRFREREYCRSVRYVPQVLFDEGSAELPEPYARNADNSSHLAVLDSLSFLNPAALQERVLKLIAVRMEEDRESTILLHPVGADAALGQRRAERVRDYLRDVWGIAPERVMIGDVRTDGLGVYDRSGRKEGVLIESSSPGITAPIVSRRLDRDFEAPLVKVTTSHQADAGLRAWEVTLTSRDKTIAHYSSEGAAGTGNLNWNMVYGEGEGDAATVTAVFMVEDSVGTRRSARSEAPLLMLRSRIAVAHNIDMREMTETLVYQLPHLRVVKDSVGSRKDSLGCDDLLRALDRDLHQGASVWIVERGGSEMSGSRLAAFRSSLNEIVRRHGVAEPQIVAPQEVAESLNEMDGCLDIGTLSDPACVVVVRQGVE